ncbi:PH domain-containing protein [Micromonospora globbae]|uniref:PH domain-containing protein n=1 Tax=Micromonospora globbae TaxID=1894969 RepID=UPI00343A4C4A|nr:PH domain-containing protein [Micromonospora globbae]
MEETFPVREWRVPANLPAAKIAGAVLLVSLGLLFADGDVVRLALACVAAAALVVWGARDLLAPVRLAADDAGVTVIQGFAGRRHLPWPAVEAITVDRRSRLGLSTETLEIDAGDSLHLFSRHDLGAEPGEVARLLRVARTAAVPESTRPPRRPDHP